MKTSSGVWWRPGRVRAALVASVQIVHSCDVATSYILRLIFPFDAHCFYYYLLNAWILPISRLNICPHSIVPMCTYYYQLALNVKLFCATTLQCVLSVLTMPIYVLCYLYDCICANSPCLTVYVLRVYVYIITSVTVAYFIVIYKYLLK